MNDERNADLGKPADALDVAAAIISEHPGLDQMQLHKLLYLVQAASLAWFDVPAFDERIEAWTWGPVVRGVAGYYKDFDRGPILEPESGDPGALSPRLHWVVDQVVSTFADISGPRLAELVKPPDGPWRHVREGLPSEASSDREIPASLIAQFHRQHGLVPQLPNAEESVAIERFYNGDPEGLADLFELATGKRPSVV